MMTQPVRRRVENPRPHHANHATGWKVAIRDTVRLRLTQQTKKAINRHQPISYSQATGEVSVTAPTHLNLLQAMFEQAA